jgi:alkylation response protein AidB-like acyl-CoA dehydrogenase
MHLAPTEEQRAIQAAARAFLTKEITRERRATWDDTPAGYDAGFWRAVAKLGWFGYGIPQQEGGQGASLLEVGLLMEECGRAAAPVAIFSTIVGSLAVAAMGTLRQRRDWLRAVAAGERQVTLALAEAEAERNPLAFDTRVRRTQDGYRITGEKRCVLQGVTADAFLIAARDGAGVSTFLVPAETAGVNVRPLATFAGDRQSVVSFDAVDVPPVALLGQRETAATALEAAQAQAAALLCADMVGGMQAVLDMTVRHASERVQFGVRIGTFQAVQTLVADMAIAAEGARHVTYQALARLAAGKSSRRELAIARAWTARSYPSLTLTAHQIHGGAGYVVEHDLHRYSGRAKTAAILFGTADDWLDILADELRLDAEPTSAVGRTQRPPRR